MHSDRVEQAMTRHISLPVVPDALCLSLSLAGTFQSSANRGCREPAENNKDTVKSRFSMDPGKENEPHTMLSLSLGMGPSTADVSSKLVHNSPNWYIKLGQAKPADASECCGTTSPLEKSEAMEKWNKLKRNCFLSMPESHEGIPSQKQHAPRKKTEAKKRRHISTFYKQEPPSGFLSRDPGIIRHVRSSQQVYSSLAAMVGSTKLDNQIQNRFGDQLQKGGIYGTDDRSKNLYSTNNQLEKPSVYLNFGGKSNESDVHDKTCSAWQFPSQYDDDPLALKLSSGVAYGSDNARSPTGDLSAKQKQISSLSLKENQVDRMLRIVRL